jgi:hypothetical protein
MNGGRRITGELDEGRVTFQRSATAAPPPEVLRETAAAAVALSDEELRTLCWALDNYLPGLRYDEVRVKLERDRHEVVVRETILSALRDRFAQVLADRGDPQGES